MGGNYVCKYYKQSNNSYKRRCLLLCAIPAPGDAIDTTKVFVYLE